MKKIKNKRNCLGIHHHHYHITNISDVSNSLVMAHNSGDNISVIVGGQLTEQETEMLRLFRSFDMRRKTEAMACLFKIEDRIKEAAGNG